MIPCKHSGDKLFLSYAEGIFLWCKIYSLNVDRKMCEVCEHYAPKVRE